MKRITLTQGKEAIVNSVDYNFLIQWKWFYNNGYAARSLKSVRIYMHREVARRAGLDMTREIDHKNRIKLDNRRRNLRPAGSSQQKSNAGLQKNNTTGYRGVTWYPSRGKYRARLKINGKTNHLGYFDTAVEASEAYNQLARQHFGEYAHLN